MTVTSAQGFRAAGVTAGIKASGRPDLALVVNDGPLDVAAGVFTSNRFQAAPVQWTRQVLSDGRLRAGVLNSGGANACTGRAGLDDARQMAEWRAASVGCEVEDVAVCSTGLIGVRLPMPALLKGIDAAVAELAADVAAGSAAAEAIKTTDTVAKVAQRTVQSQPSGAASATLTTWTVGGMAKGAGMLAPGLATMLVVITTDADLDAATADAALREAVRTTFDRIDSDGCMSTNDTVTLMASGASGITPPLDDFTAALTQACTDLAMQLQRDAEGSEHDIAITVLNAASEDDAVEVARSVARSNLFKAAVFGNDPNWGRVLASMGTTQAAFDPADLDVAMNGVWVCRRSTPAEDPSGVDLTGREVTVTIDLKAGSERATVWTNDLTHAYVHENSAYSS